LLTPTTPSRYSNALRVSMERFLRSSFWCDMASRPIWSCSRRRYRRTKIALLSTSALSADRHTNARQLLELV
jgi:hypothetical protein